MVAVPENRNRGLRTDLLKLTKKADYGLIAMRHLAEHSAQGAFSAKDIADLYAIPSEALAKILQTWPGKSFCSRSREPMAVTF